MQGMEEEFLVRLIALQVPWEGLMPCLHRRLHNSISSHECRNTNERQSSRNKRNWHRKAELYPFDMLCGLCSAQYPYLANHVSALVGLS